MKTIRSLILSMSLVLIAMGCRSTVERPAPQVEAKKAAVPKTVKVADGIHLLQIKGGNIGICFGADGVFVIDSDFPEASDKILAAVKSLTDKPLRFLVNTHWHHDHSGGNAGLGGAGALIVAHDNTRQRMTVEHFIKPFNSHVKPSPPAALPVVTFAEAVTFHFNGEEIRVLHVDPAHTDGDAIIHFKNANVMHLGDTFFNGMYPFIDVSTGGSIQGMIDAADRILPMCDEQTRLIPGHGPMAGKAALQAFRDMLAGVRDGIQPLVDQGLTLEEVVRAQPTKAWDAQWGNGYFKPEKFVAIIYSDLTRAAPADSPRHHR